MFSQKKAIVVSEKSNDALLKTSSYVPTLAKRKEEENSSFFTNMTFSNSLDSQKIKLPQSRPSTATNKKSDNKKSDKKVLNDLISSFNVPKY